MKRMDIMKAGFCTMVCAAFLILAGCNVDDTSTPVTPQELIDNGWAQYALRNYQAALDQFNQAISADGSLADAYNGAGWSQAKLDELSGAVSDFSIGLTKQSTNPEILAGLAWVYNAQRDYATSESMALAVLQADTAWVFSRDNSLTSADIRLLLAEDYFADANYTLSLAQVVILNPGFPPSLDFSGVDGRITLATEIERLRGIL
jgi:tetratricopeptide (TPR) repeat protein